MVRKYSLGTDVCQAVKTQRLSRSPEFTLHGEGGGMEFPEVAVKQGREGV